MSNLDPDVGRAVTNAEHVAHADHVDTSLQTEVASVVGHANTISTVEVHGEPLRSNAVRKLHYIREIASWVTVLCALVVMVFVIIDKNVNEDSARRDLDKFRSERATSDKLTADKLECTRRFQDHIDETTEGQLILIGEFVVVITQITPGPAREAAVKDKITELDRTNVAAREAVTAKIAYNNAGNPLPCPLEQSLPPTSSGAPPTTGG